MLHCFSKRLTGSEISFEPVDRFSVNFCEYHIFRFLFRIINNGSLPPVRISVVGVILDLV